MKGFVSFFIALFLGASLFYLVVKETGTEAIYGAVSLFWGVEGAVILLITACIVFVGSVRWKEILRSEGEDVSLSKITKYLIKGFTVDFLTPFSLIGGEAVRIFLMEKDVGVEKSSFSALVDKIMDVTAHVFFPIFGVIIFLFYGTFFHKALIIYAIGAILFIFLFLLVFYRRVFKRKSFLISLFNLLGISQKYLKDNKSGKLIISIEKKIVNFFSEKKKDFAKGMFLSFVRHFLLLFRVYLVVYFVTGSLDFGDAVIIYGFVILSMILPLPAALGGLEAILVLVFNVLGVGIVYGVFVAIALRLADLFVCALGIILFARLSLKSFHNQLKLFGKNFAK